jgi:hypothetical protein
MRCLTGKDAVVEAIVILTLVELGLSASVTFIATLLSKTQTVNKSTKNLPYAILSNV